MTTVSKSSIEAKIRGVYFINAGEALKDSNRGYIQRDLEELKLVTICIIILENGFIVLKPKTEPRKNWEKAFKTMHENGEDQMLIDDIFEDENFEEWK